MRPIKLKKTENKKTAVIISSCIIAFVVISIAAAFCRSTPTAPDPAEMTKTASIKYMASKEFAALPEAEKERYFEKIAPKPGPGSPPPAMDQLTDDERKALHQNMRKVMHSHIKKRLQKFFSSSKEEQDKMLDEMIAERKEHEKNRPDGDKGGPPPGEDPGKHMQDMLENTDSTTRAQMHEMHERMKARETGK